MNRLHIHDGYGLVVKRMVRLAGSGLVRIRTEPKGAPIIAWIG